MLLEFSDLEMDEVIEISTWLKTNPKAIPKGWRHRIERLVELLATKPYKSPTAYACSNFESFLENQGSMKVVKDKQDFFELPLYKENKVL